MPRKAQTEVVTIVLLTGIVISLVGAAYMWGVPLINKRTAVTDFLAAEDFVVKLDQKIVEIANAGSGEAALDIPNGLIEIKDYVAGNPQSNSIVFKKVVKQPLILSNSVVLKTNVLGENGTYGEAEPRVINLSSESFPPDYRLVFTLHYRELDTRNEPVKGYLISLKTGDRVGSNRMIVSYDGTDIVAGGAKNGGPLVRTKIKVSVV